MGFGKAIAIIGGIAAGAVGAYNYSTTGCPLGTGSCDAGESAALVTATSQSEGDACPLGCSMDANTDAATLMVSGEMVSGETVSGEMASTGSASCCSSMSKAAAVMAVAETTEAASSCCSAESAQAVQVAEKAESCCGQCGDDNAECDPAECTAGDACCQAVASKDD